MHLNERRVGAKRRVGDRAKDRAARAGRRLRASDGYTMAMTLMGGLLMSMIVVSAVAAVNGDINTTRADVDHKRAYEAALTGLAAYSYQLNKDQNYWEKCTSVPSPNALNQVGSTTNRRPVPGGSGATYAIELIPAAGQTSCSTADPTGTMIEQGVAADGTFRIRSTGFSAGQDEAVVATYSKEGLLDYIYFTQYETMDPVTFGAVPWAADAYAHCTRTRQEGRQSAPIPNSGGVFCLTIVFIGGEQINGPLHSNDTLVICGNPRFGRVDGSGNPIGDHIETAAPPTGWVDFCGGANPNFGSGLDTNARVLTPPPTNTTLQYKTTSSYIFSGRTKFDLNTTNMTVTRYDGSIVTMAYPASGVVYVKNISCGITYTPYGPNYSAGTGCGDAVVKGNYDDRLTIAAENDVLIEGNLTRSGDGMLGLIANNFVRVYHPCDRSTSTNLAGALSNLRIDAAILAIQHSFINDNFDCGAPLGTLTINGALAQRFRGPVGQFNASGPVHGYSKNYTYDNRLKYVQPPHFLDPVQTAWHIDRQSLDDG